MYLNCHVNSQDHLIKQSCKFIFGSLLPLPYIVTTLVSLMTVEMFLICHVTAREQMFKGLRETMGGSP